MAAHLQAHAEQPGIRVAGKIINLTPGAHGFHLHEIGNCTTPGAIDEAAEDVGDALEEACEEATDSNCD